MASCRYCQNTCLHWKKVLGAWKLFDGEKLHKCQSGHPEMPKDKRVEQKKSVKSQPELIFGLNLNNFDIAEGIIDKTISGEIYVTEETKPTTTP